MPPLVLLVTHKLPRAVEAPLTILPVLCPMQTARRWINTLAQTSSARQSQFLL